MFYFILLLFGTTIEAASHGYTYFRDADSWLKFHNVPATWTDALLKCEAEGSTLASPVNKVILEAMKAKIISNHQSCSIFTGIHQTYTPGSFYTTKGIPLSDVAAKLIRTKDQCTRSVSDCLILQPDGSLSDTECSDRYSYICQKTDLKIAKNTCYAGVNSGYRLDERSGSCYKFHNPGATWYEAAKICAMEGGYLAVINSDIEAQVLKELFALHHPSTFGKQLNYLAFIGFRKWDAKWATVFGESLDEAGYARWAPSQPDNPNVQQCGAIYRQAELDDLECHISAAFICEIPLNTRVTVFSKGNASFDITTN